MGDIIRLRPRQEARSGRTAPAEADHPGSATILIFTGVRYERHETPSTSEPTRPQRRGGRRKRA